MDHDTFWQKQTTEPLFPEVLWNKPENAWGAGKLLVIGGTTHGFAAPARAYNEATAAKAGSVRAVLPETLRHVVGDWLTDAFFAPVNRSGSFSKQALATLLEQASWSQAVLFAGDLGRNSETAITLESFVKRYGNLICLCKDSIDYFSYQPHTILHRPHTLLILSYEQLQKIGIRTKQTQPLTFTYDLPHVTEWLHAFTGQFQSVCVTYFKGHFLVAHKGEVVSYAAPIPDKTWRVKAAAWTSVYVMQQPHVPLQAAATALFEAFSQKNEHN